MSWLLVVMPIALIEDSVTNPRKRLTDIAVPVTLRVVLSQCKKASILQPAQQTNT
jgi:hypothetical protein